MSNRNELFEKYSKASSLQEYVEIAKTAIEQLAEKDLVLEILDSATDECKFPSDYILVAEIFAQIGEREKAIELYEEAEDNAFEPMEFAEIGKSLARSLNDYEKANELFKQAIISAKKNKELFTILKYLNQVLPNSSLISDIINKLIEECKSIDDFINLIENLQDGIDLSTLSLLFRSFEQRIERVANCISFAHLVNKYLKDFDWSTKIIEECADKAKFSNEFIMLAKYYNSVAKVAQAKKMLEKGKDLALSVEEVISVAFAYWEILQDSSTVKLLIEKVFEDIKDRNELIKLAEFSTQELADRDLTFNILKTIESKSNSAAEFIEVVNLYSILIGDESQTLRIYSNLLEKFSEPKDLVDIGLDIVKRTLNTENARDFFAKALENSSRLEQIFLIAEKAKDFGLTDIVLRALQKAECYSKTTIDYLQVGEKYFNLLSIIDRAKQCFEIAEEMVSSLNEMKTVGSVISKYFTDDTHWNERISIKIHKREEKQNEYDALLKLEQDLKFFVDYLNLADEIMVKLDDVYYCRKILQKAEKFLQNQPLNIDNYAKLAKYILKYAKDEKWVRDLFEFVFKNKIHFMNESEYLIEKFSDILPEKQYLLNIFQRFLFDKIASTKRPDEVLKIAKILFKYNLQNVDTIEFLERSLEKANTFHLFELLQFASESKLSQLLEKSKRALFDKIQNAEELVLISKKMISFGIPKDEIIEQIINFVNRTNNNDLITISENLLNLLNDKVLSLNIISKIEKKPHTSRYVSKIRNIIAEGKYW